VNGKEGKMGEPYYIEIDGKREPVTRQVAEWAVDRVERIDFLTRQVAEWAVDRVERIDFLERRAKRASTSSIQLCYDDGLNPFAREDLKIVDYGYADQAYVVESELVDQLRTDLAQATHFNGPVFRVPGRETFEWCHPELPLDLYLSEALNPTDGD
jgi:hypothetical protein